MSYGMCIVTDPHEPKHVTSDLALIILEPEDNELYFESNTAITNKEICENTKRD